MQICITDMNISPNVTMAKYIQLWNDHRYPGADNHSEGDRQKSDTESHIEQDQLQIHIDATGNQEIDTDDDQYSQASPQELRHRQQWAFDLEAWPRAPARE